jgi:hypothetical protein
LLLALFFDDGVTGCLELSLPGRQQGLIKRADGSVSHGVAPQLVVARMRLALGGVFEGIPINIEYPQEIADPLMMLMESKG